MLNQWKGRRIGFGQQDYALRNAAWRVADIFADEMKDGQRPGFLDYYTLEQEGPGEKVIFDDIEQATAQIKHIAELLGAADVGIAAIDERWHYSHKYKAQTQTTEVNELLSGITHVIVLVCKLTIIYIYIYIYTYYLKYFYNW